MLAHSRPLRIVSLRKILVLLLFVISYSYALAADEPPTVSVYGIFETQILNSRQYQNPLDFNEIELKAQFRSASGRQWVFSGFYDGDGEGGARGAVWKLRFMPDEPGLWSYVYTWSDGTPGGHGRFTAVDDKALPGILRPYERNPHWLAYNGKTPVFLKSYYVSIWPFTGTPIDWSVEKVYKRLLKHGYNHVQLPILPVNPSKEPNFTDSPPYIAESIFDDETPSKSMNLAVWRRLEEHLFWLNKNRIAVHFFQGFDGKDNGPRWHKMTPQEKDFYVRYAMARLAPFSNVFGWNYTWETPGHWGEPELMALLAKYDPWDHLRSYEDQFPLHNYYCEDHYTFAGIENQGYLSSKYDSLSHHYATLHAFCGKPVYMVEGNGLWMWGWFATAEQIRKSAWGVVTAGGSFTWNDIPDGRRPGGTGKLANQSKDIFHSPAFRHLEILYQVMTRDLVFYLMKPHDELLSGFTGNGYCLAQKGRQYLAYFESSVEPVVSLDLKDAPLDRQFRVVWVQPLSGHRFEGKNLRGGSVVKISKPWSGEAVLIVKDVHTTQEGALQ